MSAASPLPPIDSMERSLALDPTRSFIVQAPAGSGKTELLIRRFLTLLAHVERPESILAVTFTRKAAAEMRARVLEVLRKSLDSEEQSSGRAVMERDARLGWNLLTSPSRLRVETIDALGLHIARRMPYLARFGAMPEIVDDATELYEEAARATLLLLAEDRYAGAVETLALHVDNDLQRAVQLLVLMLTKRDQWLRHLGAGNPAPGLRETLESTLAELVTGCLRRLKAAFPEQQGRDLARLARFAARNLSRANADHPVVRCVDLEVLPDTGAGSLPLWQSFAELLLTGAGELRSKVDRRMGFPPEHSREKREFSGLLSQMARNQPLLACLAELRGLPAPRYTDGQWAFLEALFDVLPAAAAQLKIVFQRRGIVDFAELAQAAQRALGDPADPTDLGLVLGHRIEHILVDEVQDTSVTQMRLIESLIAGWEEGDGRTLFLVGDPMQSIYKFREAEVGVFLRVRREGLSGFTLEPVALRANFRSRPGIVDWVNRRLSMIFPANEEILSGAVPYSPSEAFRDPAGQESVWVHPLLEDDPEIEARLTVDLVERARRDYPDGRTAVLVRARTHLPAIVGELKRRRILFRAVEIDLLAEVPVVGDLLALTRALLHPADRTAWLALLRGPWCGLTLAELYDIARPDEFGTIWDLLPETPRLERFRRAIGAALVRVRRERIRACVERVWIEVGGPSCIDEGDLGAARRYFALLDELEEGGEVNIPRLEARVAALYADPDPAASNALELMTIHKAKGLEFDVVILPGLGHTAGRDDEPLLRWAEVPTERGLELLFAPVESAGDDHDPTYRYLRRLDRARTRQETARLLYVASTRARERLHLIGHTTVKEGELVCPRAGSLLDCLWPAVEAKFRAAIPEGRNESPPQPVSPPRRISRLSTDWEAPPCPTAVGWQATGSGVAEGERVSFEWVSDTLRTVGMVVHAFLDRVAREGVHCWDADRIRSQRAVIRGALATHGLPPSEVAGAADRVERALAQTLADPRGRWILERRKIEACELPAMVVQEDRVRSVVVDRTFVDEDNVRWVIDYKTSDHGGGGLDVFLDNELQRYREQLETYASLFRLTESRKVKCGLYFPLLGAWREL